MERTLDDSANRRLSLPQSFLAIDAVLILYRNVIEGLVVHPRVIERNLREELPFLATEEILMAGVRAGGDRQVLHERIRVHSQEAARQVKDEGAANDLFARLKADPAFAGVDLADALDARKFVGRAPSRSTPSSATSLIPFSHASGPISRLPAATSGFDRRSDVKTPRFAGELRV